MAALQDIPDTDELVTAAFQDIPNRTNTVKMLANMGIHLGLQWFQNSV